MSEYTYDIDKYTIGVDENGEDGIGMTVAKIENGGLHFLGNCYGENARCIDLLIKENQELKKQLEEYKATNEVLSHELTKDKVLQQDCLTTCCGIPIGDMPKLINQQKKFIEYLEYQVKLQEELNDIHLATGFEEILSKYKEIIGVPMAGLDDEEEPDLFEMIEDMKNKFKHIEEINKSYPIFNFDKKKF